MSELGIVVKKPSSIKGLDVCIVINRLILSKDKIGFFITSPYLRVLSEKNLIIPKTDYAVSLCGLKKIIHAANA